MKDSSQAHLHDIIQAAHAVRDFVATSNYQDYNSNELLRSAVERKFEIIGEALNRIHKSDPELLLTIPSYRKIISFRNILIHGYDAIDDRIVWGVIQEDLEPLIQHAESLLA